MCVNKTVGQCMSNSIETLRYNQKFVFEDITNRQAPSDYWLKSPLPPTIPQKHEQTQQTENGDTYNVTGFKIITPEEARKTHNTKVIGLSVAGATIVTGLGVFALMPFAISRSIPLYDVFAPKYPVNRFSFAYFSASSIDVAFGNTFLRL